ncbi:copper homeostasis protein [Arthrobacter pigmenti]|uniref:PF03932 family protein CutC n=1 Tax=Arthrobacter pigmenti TaxID=271432 RepID=A0A846RWW8_9MICC|nr:copper homeostasis protein CutC [Arthrobacter pigmenti]NJC24085.1 copper homeostasis protein [Arthrobacter pigmenti]
MTTLEIAVQDAAGARTALENGADRVEFCAALRMGGHSPSLAAVEQAVAVGIGVHVLVRPRGGGYVYSPAEVDLMVAEAEQAVRAGAAGVVIGALTHGDTSLDAEALGRIIDAARGVNPGAEITVHRCVDVLLERGLPVESLIVELRQLGVDRVLTSGGARTAGEGVGMLLELRQIAGGNPQIQAGGGVRLADIPALSGLDGIHLSARAARRDGASGPGGGEEDYDVTDPELVAAAAAALTGH